MRILALITCFLAPALSHGDEAAAWEKFKSTEAGFAAVFPAKPKMETGVDNTKVGDRRWVTVSAALTDGSRYQAASCDLPRIGRPLDLSYLKVIRDCLIDKDGKVITEVEITLGEEKVGGYALLIEKNGTYNRVRLFLQGDRRYQVSVIGTKEEVTSKDADRFLDSFELVK